MRDNGTGLPGVRFSYRTQWDTAETEWAQALAARRARSLPIYDLTASNPTQCGFEYDGRMLEALNNPASLRYEPDAQGLPAAREAVCNYYRTHAAMLTEARVDLTVSQVFLTTSTSEAYSFLFRLLCDPGDEVLIAQPSYPLFDFLATLDDVKLSTYPLFYDFGWHLDLFGLRQKITHKTRAIIVVHPNNPTGHFTREVDRRALESICQEFGLALIVDEVFLDYSFGKGVASFAVGRHPALTFVLSGLSKAAGLPQMKLSWIAAFGSEMMLKEALARLDVIADTFLSLSAPMQLALPTWLEERQLLQRQILTRTRVNLHTLDDLLLKTDLVHRLDVEAGWYATLRAPNLRSGEEAALWLLKEAGVAVHPGNFFGLAGDGCFVVSLLTEPAVFHEGATRLLHFLAA